MKAAATVARGTVVAEKPDAAVGKSNTAAVRSAVGVRRLLSPFHRSNDQGVIGRGGE